MMSVRIALNRSSDETRVSGQRVHSESLTYQSSEGSQVRGTSGGFFLLLPRFIYCLIRAWRDAVSSKQERGGGVHSRGIARKVLRAGLGLRHFHYGSCTLWSSSVNGLRTMLLSTRMGASSNQTKALTSKKSRTGIGRHLYLASGGLLI